MASWPDYDIVPEALTHCKEDFKVEINSNSLHRAVSTVAGGNIAERGGRSDAILAKDGRQSRSLRVLSLPAREMSGSELVARSMDCLLEEDAVVMGVPGSPTTGIVDWLESESTRRGSRFWVEMNEVDMMRKLLGTNAHGLQSVAIMKHTGFFRIQEQLVAMSNHDLRAPMVLLVGDEPGASSQNGNDSRGLCDATYLPVIEPSFHNVPDTFSRCLSLSCELRKPVVFRVVPGMVDYIGKPAKVSHDLDVMARAHASSGRDYFATEGMVIGRYTRTKRLLGEMKLADYSGSSLNSYRKGDSEQLVIAAGNMADRVRGALARIGSDVGFLEINTVSQLPEILLSRILGHYRSVLVMESWEPYLEQRVCAFVQRTGMNELKIYGRESAAKPEFCASGLASAGDLSDRGVQCVLERFFTGGDVSAEYHHNAVGEHGFSRDIDNRYINIFGDFCSIAFSQRKRPVFSVSTGRTRYSVMDSKFEQYVKFMAPMGSEAMTLLGYLEHSTENLAPCVIVGDYTFCHSAWHGLSSINSYRAATGQKVPTLIIDNGGSWTTGGHGCNTPLTVGVRQVAGWERRLYGCVGIHQREAVREAIRELLDASSPRDILIISVDN